MFATTDEATRSRFKTRSPTAKMALSAWCQQRPREDSHQAPSLREQREGGHQPYKEETLCTGRWDGGRAGDCTMQSRGGDEGREGPLCPTGFSGPIGMTLPAQGAGADPAQRP